MSYKGYASILQLAFEREYARRDGDYARSDSIRKELYAKGVTLDDRAHSFRTESGLMGHFDLQRGVSIDEVQMICLDREEARRDNNYREADAIRDQLAELGVTVQDRTHTFTMPDGQEDTYDLVAVRKLQKDPPRSQSRGGGKFDKDRSPVRNSGGRGFGGGAAYNGSRSADPKSIGGFNSERAGRRHESEVLRRDPSWNSGGAGGAYSSGGGGAYAGAGGGARSEIGISSGGAGTGDRFRGYFQALNLALEREEARKNRDYAGGDRVRAEMKALGVEVHDPSHTFTMTEKGLDGSYDLVEGVTPHEVQMVALEREEVRRARDYAASDRLRDWLLDQGATVDDRTHVFKLPDGVTGSYDLYSWKPVEFRKSGGDRKRRRE